MYLGCHGELKSFVLEEPCSGSFFIHIFTVLHSCQAHLRGVHVNSSYVCLPFRVPPFLELCNLYCPHALAFLILSKGRI